MGILTRIRTQLFSDPSIPIGGKIYRMNTKEWNQPLKYDYVTIEKLLDDERVVSIVGLVASLVSDAYVGPEIHPKDRFKDDKIDDNESKALASAIKFARSQKFKRKCFEYAWQVITHGDMFEKIVKLEDGKGIEKLVPLPLNATRVLEFESQKKSRGAGAQMQEENFISVMKTVNDTDPKIYDLAKKEYFHISFKPHGVWREDIQGSDTFSIYSKSPIATLQRLKNWKDKTIENDIIWKNKLLPRILYKLKMPSIIPSKYTGTPSEKIDQATADATKLTTTFINETKTLRPDDDIVISDAAEATILEAKSVNYQQPNEVIGQINAMLNSPQGIPGGLLGGENAGAVASELASIFSGIRINYIINLIADALAEVMKSHVILDATSVGEEVVDRLYILSDPALTIEKFQKVKIALSMAATQIFTKAECRQAAGYPRLPQVEIGLMATQVNVNIKASIAELEKNIEQESSNSEQNNRSEKGKVNTTEETDDRP